MIPKVVFTKMKKDINIDIIKWALSEDDDSMNIYDFTIDLMPELKNSTDVEGVVSKYYNTLTKDIESSISRYQSVWDAINDKYMKTLEKYLNISWSGSDQIIVDVGFIPVSPRYLDTCSFSIVLGMEDDKLINIVFHEVLHFYWFMKFKEVLPNIPREEYDFPCKAWKYSEMITEVILNSNEVINATKIKEKSCYNFDRKIIEKLKKIFDSDLTIEEKILNGYELVYNTD